MLAFMCCTGFQWEAEGFPMGGAVCGEGRADESRNETRYQRCELERMEEDAATGANSLFKMPLHGKFSRASLRPD